jgi:hypothetical protein
MKVMLRFECALATLEEPTNRSPAAAAWSPSRLASRWLTITAPPINEGRTKRSSNASHDVRLTLFTLRCFRYPSNVRPTLLDKEPR